MVAGQLSKSVNLKSMVKLIGQYRIDKSNLLRPDLHLVIGTRKQPSPSKPKNYLLHRQGKRHQYLSSLYPAPVSLTDAQIWQLEFEGQQFTLTVNEAANVAENKPAEGGGGKLP